MTDKALVQKALVSGDDQTRIRNQVKVDPAEIKALSRPDLSQSMFQITLEWAAILGAAAVCHLHFHPVLYVLVVIWIGSRQHALGILFHDGIHGRLARNATVNRWISELLLAWPLFVTFDGYRREHFAHHRWVGTDKDPDLLRTQYGDYQFPMGRARFYLTLMKHLAGVNTIRDYHNALIIAGLTWPVPMRVNVLRLAYYALGAAVITYFGLWLEYVMYWLVPVSTALVVVMYFRLVAEHSGVRGALLSSRNVYPTTLEGLLLAPNNVNFHLDHHLYPSVPFYNLPKLHRLLLQDPVYAAQARNTNGYFAGVISECVRAEHEHGRTDQAFADDVYGEHRPV